MTDRDVDRSLLRDPSIIEETEERYKRRSITPRR